MSCSRNRRADICHVGYALRVRSTPCIACTPHFLVHFHLALGFTSFQIRHPTGRSFAIGWVGADTKHTSMSPLACDPRFFIWMYFYKWRFFNSNLKIEKFGKNQNLEKTSKLKKIQGFFLSEVFFFCDRRWLWFGGKLLRQEFQKTPALSPNGIFLVKHCILV